MKMEEEKKEMVVPVYENKEGTSNDIGVMDEIGVDMLKNQLVSLYAEEEAFTVGLGHATDAKNNYVEQWAIDEELLDLQLSDFGMIESAKTHVIHNNPRFWELQKKQFEYKIRHEKFQAENQVKGYDKEIEAATNQLEHISKRIEEVTSQLTELGEEIPQREVKKND